MQTFQAGSVLCCPKSGEICIASWLFNYWYPAYLFFCLDMLNTWWIFSCMYKTWVRMQQDGSCTDEACKCFIPRISLASAVCFHRSHGFGWLGIYSLILHRLFRPPISALPLLCWPLWRCQWSCECCHELDTQWWRQWWFLSYQHYHQCSSDPIWWTSEHHHCQYHTATYTDWFSCRLWIQHYSAWCQLWESGGGEEWAPGNQTSKYVHTLLGTDWVISMLARWNMGFPFRLFFFLFIMLYIYSCCNSHKL